MGHSKSSVKNQSKEDSRKYHKMTRRINRSNNKCKM